MSRPDLPTFPGTGMHRIGIVIPACDEEECIGEVLAEIEAVLEPGRFLVAVGVNGSHDGTAALCRRLGVLTGVTDRRGYGHGCLAALAALEEADPEIDAYLFMAADGANDPRDIPALLAGAARGFDLVLGTRTTRRSNLPIMKLSHVIANRLLGLWAGWLAGYHYTDLGPMRLIRRSAFDALQMRELTFGWTIEPQVAAPALGLSVVEVPVSERRRRGGEQKVSGVSVRRSLGVGLAIFCAGWRTHLRWKSLGARSYIEPQEPDATGSSSSQGACESGNAALSRPPQKI